MMQQMIQTKRYFHTHKIHVLIKKLDLVIPYHPNIQMEVQ